MSNTYIPGYVLSDEKFAVLKRRYEWVVDKCLDSLDKRIIPLVKTLGGLPGIAPIWSCSGHTDVEQEAKLEIGEEIINGEGHVIFAVSKEGLTSLQALQEFISTGFDESLWNSIRPEISLSKLQWVWDLDSSEPDPWLDQEKMWEAGTYSAWEIKYSDHASGSLHHVQERFQELLNDFVEAYLEGKKK